MMAEGNSRIKDAVRLRVGARARYAAASASGQFLYAGLLFAGSVMLARLLGVDGKGEYTAWTVASVTIAIAVGGPLSVGFGRSVLSGTRASARIAIRHALACLPLTAAASIVLIVVGASVPAVVACVLLSPLALAAGRDLLYMLQAAKRGWWFQATRISGAVASTIGIAVVVVAELGPDAALDAALGLWAAGAAVSLAVGARLTSRLEGPQAGLGLRDLAELGRGSYGAMLSEWLLFRLDQLILVAISGAGPLGLYSVAVNWAEVTLYVGHAIGDSVFEGEERLDAITARTVLKKVAILMTLVAVAVAICGVILIGPIFGDAFEDAAPALLLLAPGVAAKSIGYSAGQMLLARGRGGELSRLMLVTLGFGCLAWPSLIALAGVEGAAAASTASYLLYMVLACRAATIPR